MNSHQEIYPVSVLDKEKMIITIDNETYKVTSIERCNIDGVLVAYIEGNNKFFFVDDM